MLKLHNGSFIPRLINAKFVICLNVVNVHWKLFKPNDSFLRLTSSRENARSHCEKEIEKMERKGETERRKAKETAQKEWNGIMLVVFKERERITIKVMMIYFSFVSFNIVDSFVHVIDLLKELQDVSKNVCDRLSPIRQ